MKKIIFAIIVVVVFLIWSFIDNKPSQTTNTNNIEKPLDYGNIHKATDDKLNTEESNNAIAVAVRKLTEQVDQNTSKQQNSNAETKGLNQQIKSLQQQIAQLQQPLPVANQNNSHLKKNQNNLNVKPVVQKLINVVNQGVGGLSTAPIGSPKNTRLNFNNNQNNQQIDNSNGFTWTSGINSLRISKTIDTSNQKLSNTSINQNKETQQTPSYIIPANSFLKAILKTALLGRIPISGKVSDPYRFVLDISDKALFANFKSHKELIGMRMSGLSQGDLLLSCAKGSIDSITYIFVDETISQVNGVDLAIITDKYGQPCIKGELMTNAPKIIGISAGLSALSSAADALAQGEQTTSQSADGNTSQSLTGSAGKFAVSKGIGDGISNINQWVGDRAKSSFDVIKVPSGKEIVLLTQKEIAIYYEPNQKLRHTHNNTYHEIFNTQLD